MNYRIKKQKTVKVQQGDHWTIAFLVPEIFELTGIDSIRFQVLDKRNVVVNKTTTTILIFEQNINIPLLPEDTENLNGDSFFWELEVVKNGIRTTIGQGPFELLKTYIRNA